MLGYTSSGPHRHDIIFSFNNSPAISVASRGEVRTIIITLKQLEAALVEEVTGQKPVVLLDDVFSELDLRRQKSLIVGRSYQTVITSTDDRIVSKITKSSKLSIVVKI
jgi:DNA replication and repair protein RecF